MMITRIALSMLALLSTAALALAQGAGNKSNGALQQLKDQKQSSQEAASTLNPEKSKAKSNQGNDTAQPASTYAGQPSNKSKAEREREAIRAYTSAPPTGEAQRLRLQRAAVVPPAPGTKPAAPAPAKPAAAAVSNKPAPVAAAPGKPAAAAASPKPVAAAAPRPAPVATAAPARPSTSTYTSSSSSTSTTAPKR